MCQFFLRRSGALRHKGLGRTLHKQCQSIGKALGMVYILDHFKKILIRNEMGTISTIKISLYYPNVLLKLNYKNIFSLKVY